MPIRTIYILGTAATSPNWFGVTQLDGSAPTAANSAYGFAPAKTALTTPYYRGRLGATGTNSTAQAASWNAAQTAPQKGTGSAGTTAGDSFVAGPFSGTFPSGNWTFNWNLRAGTAGAIGRVNMRMWRGANADGSGATQVLANTNGATVTLSTSSDLNSSITANPGALTLTNEYLFFQVEWQETTVGSANGDNVFFRLGTSSIVTTNYTYAPATGTGTLAAAISDVDGVGTVTTPSIAYAWDANDKTSSITLSSNDKIATSSNTVSVGVRSTKRNTNGDPDQLLYAEFKLGGSFHGNSLIGLSDATKSVYDQNSVMSVDGNGNVYGYSHQSMGLAWFGGISAGNVVSMVWDTGYGRIWFRKNNGYWNNNASADPAAGTGFYNVGSAPFNQFALSFISALSGENFELRTRKADFTQTTPGGVKSWMGETLGVSGTGALQAVATQARTNYQFYSQQFEAWSNGSVSIGINSGAQAPDGSYTADAIVADAGYGTHFLYGDVSQTVPGPKDYCFSVYGRDSSGRWMHMVQGAAWANFNLVTGLVGNSFFPDGGGATITPDVNGWMRCSIWAYRNQAVVQSQTRIYLIDDDQYAASPAFDQGGLTEHWWGAQFEEGRDPTAYIKTDAVPVSVPGGSIVGVGNVVTYKLELDPAKTSSLITLSNGNLTASRTGTGSYNVPYYGTSLSFECRGTKVYVETVTPTGVTDSAFGLSNAMIADSANNPVDVATGWLGEPGGGSIGLYSNGDIYYDNALITTLSPVPAPGDVLALALDRTIKVVAFRNVTKGGSWTMQYSVASLGTGAMYVGYSLGNYSGSTVSCTINFGATALAGSPPDTSYTAWDGKAFPVTGTGALQAVAASRTNYATYSQDLADSTWAKNNLNLASNAVMAPDGTMTADTCTTTALLSNHYVYQYAATPVAVTGLKTISAHLKDNGAVWVSVSDGYTGGYSNFNLLGGSVGLNSGITSNSITPLGGGWYRCSITLMETAGSSMMPTIAFPNGNSGSSYHGVGNLSAHVWGVQYEDGPTLTAYIPTTTVAISITNTLVGTGTVSWRATGALVAGTPRTNRVRYSSDLDNTLAWGYDQVTVTANNIAAPDATMTAERLTDTAASNQHYFYQGNVETGTGETYTTSFYVKAGTLSWFQILTNAYSLAWANFNVATGELGQKISPVITHRIEALPNGWYRCSMTFPSEAAGGWSYVYGNLLQADLPFGSSAYAGGSGTLYLWGVQFERSDAPTAYIPTMAAPVTVGSTPPSIAGVGTVITPPAIGTGALTSTGVALVANGVSSSSGTAILPPFSISTLAGAGVSRSVSTSAALAANVASLNAVGASSSRQTSASLVASISASAGVGISSSPGVAVLASGASAIVGTLSNTGTGSLLTLMSTLAGAGVSRSVSTSAVLIDAVVSLAASGVGQSTGTASLPSSQAVLAGAGLGATLGTAALAGQTASLTGAGVARWVATGALAPNGASVAGSGQVQFTASGALNPNLATVTGAGVSRSVATASLLASLASVNGSEGVSVITGTGDPRSQSSDLVGAGQVKATGTGALSPLGALVAGAGLSRSEGSSSSLIARASAVTAPGVGASTGTGALAAGVSDVDGFGGIAAAPTGTGALAASAAILAGLGGAAYLGSGVLSATQGNISGTGKSAWAATGTLQALVSVLAGAGVARWIGTGTLVANDNVASGAGLALSSGTAALQAPRANIAGFEGVSVVIGNAALQAQSRIMAGAGLARSVGTGILPASDPVLAGAAVSVSRGTGELAATSDVLEGEGSSEVNGTSELIAAHFVLSAIGTVVDKIVGAGVLTTGVAGLFGFANLTTAGTGVLRAADHVSAANGLAISTGFGAPFAHYAEIDAEGVTRSSGSAALVSQRALFQGFGKVETTIVGVGALVSQPALFRGYGYQLVTGAGDLVSRAARIIGAEEIVAGDGALFAGDSTISGEGVLGVEPEVPWVSTPLPGGYPGTAPWLGAGTTTWKGGAACWTNPGTGQWVNPGTTLPPWPRKAA